MNIFMVDHLLMQLKKKYPLDWKSLTKSKYSIVKETEQVFLSKFKIYNESNVSEIRYFFILIIPYSVL